MLLLKSLILKAFQQPIVVSALAASIACITILAACMRTKPDYGTEWLACIRKSSHRTSMFSCCYSTLFVTESDAPSPVVHAGSTIFDQYYVCCPSDCP